MKLAVYSISKNESHHVERWVASTKGADYVYVLDTGSDDDTVEKLRGAGVVTRRGCFDDAPRTYEPFGDLAPIPVVSLGPTFRFDVARNAALNALPDDIDICVSLDLDEILADGALDAIRAAWTPGITKLRPWIFTGTWWRCDRVHARHGYRWICPCHEVTEYVGPAVEILRDVEAQLHHLPDDHDRRPLYLSLLTTAVAERPNDARMWTYLCREYHFSGNTAATIIAARHLVDLNDGWAPEVAGACRLAALACTSDSQRLAWLTEGTKIAPLEAEPWAALAKFHYDRQEWEPCFDAALAGVECPPAMHYLTDQLARAWGLWDFAAVAAHNLGAFNDALRCGYKAWRANPDDGRLQANVHFMQRAVDIPTFAVIPKKAGERDGMTSALVEQLEAQGVDCVVDDWDRPLHAKWNAGMDTAAARARSRGAQRFNVLVINNDVQVGPAAVERLAAGLRSDSNVAAACPAAGEAFAGWCFMLRGEQEWRVDEDFEWWYGDTDLAARIAQAGRTVECVPVDAVHLHPNESTVASPERLDAARRDEKRFAEKHDVDPATLFLARNPLWGVQ